MEAEELITYCSNFMANDTEKTNIKNKCHICDKDFEQLDIHFLEFHSEEFDTQESSEELETVFENFDNDSQISKVPNSININGRERIRENLKELTSDANISPKNLSYILPNNMSSSSSLKIDNLKCYECNLYFSTPKKLQNHIKSGHITVIDDREIDNLKCYECNLYFSTPENLQNHIESGHITVLDQETENLKCYECNIYFSTPEKLQNHIESGHKYFSTKENVKNIQDSLQSPMETPTPTPSFINIEDKENVFPKPPYSFPCLIALALKNSQTGSMSVLQIYNFMCEHFPYFKNAGRCWKGFIRTFLRGNICFEKLGKSKSNLSKKGIILWTMKRNKMNNLSCYCSALNNKLKKYSTILSKDIKKAMAVPESLSALVKGEIKKDYNANYPDVDSDDEEDHSCLSSVSSEASQDYDLASLDFNGFSHIAPVADSALQEINLQNIEVYEDFGDNNDKLTFGSLSTFNDVAAEIEVNTEIFHPYNLKCEMCEFKAKSIQHFKDHLLHKHYTEAFEKRGSPSIFNDVAAEIEVNTGIFNQYNAYPYECEFCEFKPKNFHHFSHHLIHYHYSEEFQKYICQPWPITCPIASCQTICVNKPQMLRHFCEHGIVRKFLKNALGKISLRQCHSCPICNKKILYKNFKEHIQIAHCVNGKILTDLVHHNTFTHQCYFCYKKFTNTFSYKKHIQRFHFNLLKKLVKCKKLKVILTRIDDDFQHSDHTYANNSMEHWNKQSHIIMVFWKFFNIWIMIMPR